MRPVAASDFNPFGGTVFVDWMRMSSYANAGTFTSRVFDASAPVDWHSIQWTASTPAGGGVSISVRTGNTPNPDATWSAFAPVAVPRAAHAELAVHPVPRCADLADPTQTPALEDIIISTGHAPVAVADTATVAGKRQPHLPALRAGQPDVQRHRRRPGRCAARRVGDPDRRTAPRA